MDSKLLSLLLAAMGIAGHNVNPSLRYRFGHGRSWRQNTRTKRASYRKQYRHDQTVKAKRQSRESRRINRMVAR